VAGKLTPELREGISSMVSAKGWNLRELRTEGASLEEYYVRITDPGAAAA
jgi:hypothetical protein